MIKAEQAFYFKEPMPEIIQKDFTLVVDGNVGIGTVTPTTLLNVVQGLL